MSKNSLKTILLAAPLYPPDSGGPALHAKEYELRFRKRGYEVRLAVFSRLLFMPFGLRHLVYIFKLFYFALGADLIYALDATSVGIPALITAKVLRKPLLYRIGGDLLWERLAERSVTELSMRKFYDDSEHLKRPLFLAIRISLNQVDRIIVPSNILKEVYVKWYRVSADRITVISNPLPNKVDIGFVKEERTIVYASRMVRYKNLDLVLDAVVSLRSRLMDVRFILMGDGPELQRLRERVLKENLGGLVSLPGRVSEGQVLAETQACMITLGPAYTEFSPNAILRGIACGKPFLISREHGLPFVVPEFLTFEPTSVDDFVKKISHLLTPEGYLAAKQWVATLDYHQTWDDIIDKNAQIINNLVHT